MGQKLALLWRIYSVLEMLGVKELQWVWSTIKEKYGEGEE